MATFHQVQNLNINDLVLKLEVNVNNYISIRKTSAPDVERNIQSILSWAEDEKANAKQGFEEDKIAKVGIVIEKCADSLESLSSEDPIQFMKGVSALHHLWIFSLVDRTEILP